MLKRLRLGSFRTQRLALLSQVIVLSAVMFSAGCESEPRVTMTGELSVWFPLTFTFDGPESSESATPNPFTDYRLNVTFTSPDQRTYVVPGFYAADGATVETSATVGDKWRTRFTPDQPGRWHLKASFRAGENIAISLDPVAGDAVSFDGESATFEVQPAQVTAPGFLRKGMLRYVGKRYLQFAGSGEYFLKGGTDSPENLLAYADFDGTEDVPLDRPANRQIQAEPFLHRYEPHVQDWREGDPLWQGGKGKGLFGGLNYLWKKGVNSIYFLTQNIDGDGNDVWPWTAHDERLRFDVSKLAQWEVIFSHADRLGILLHVVTSETENDDLLDGGELGAQRKLYYRELVARFGHHLALQWNIGEENQNSTEQRKAYCEYFEAIDPYDHPIVLHTNSTLEAHELEYPGLLGYEYFEGASMQIRDDPLVHDVIKNWIRRSTEAGRPWIVSFDEQRLGSNGIEPDSDDPMHEGARRDHLWATLMAGGAGIEWYFGYTYPHNDITLEDWRSRDKLWDLTRYAVGFFQDHLPFWEMESADELTAAQDDYVFRKKGEVYAVYIPYGATTRLDLSETDGEFEVAWFSPRAGGKLLQGTVQAINTGGPQSLGRPPNDPRQDWGALGTRAK